MIQQPLIGSSTPTLPPTFQLGRFSGMYPAGGGGGGGGGASDTGTLAALANLPAGSLQELAARMAQEQYGWGPDQFAAIDQIVRRESGWNPAAANKSSSARGLFQKMTSIHGPVESTPEGQIGWGLGYLSRRYGTPQNALAFWNRNRWY